MAAKAPAEQAWTRLRQAPPLWKLEGRRDLHILKCLPLDAAWMEGKGRTGREADRPASPGVDGSPVPDGVAAVAFFPRTQSLASVARRYQTDGA